MGIRTARELKTIALTLDHLCSGKVLEGMDVLSQRFKALEIATLQQKWDVARWVELLPPQDVSSSSRAELHQARSEEREDLRLRTAVSVRNDQRPRGQQWQDWRPQGKGEKGEKGGKGERKGKKGGKGQRQVWYDQ